MSHIFHFGILAYLIFIFTACGYKADPFYGEGTMQKIDEQEEYLEQKSTQGQKNILFQEINSQPAQGYEVDED